MITFTLIEEMFLESLKEVDPDVLASGPLDEDALAIDATMVLGDLRGPDLALYRKAIAKGMGIMSSSERDKFVKGLMAVAKAKGMQAKQVADHIISKLKPKAQKVKMSHYLNFKEGLAEARPGLSEDGLPTEVGLVKHMKKGSVLWPTMKGRTTAGELSYSFRVTTKAAAKFLKDLVKKGVLEIQHGVTSTKKGDMGGVMYRLAEEDLPELTVEDIETMELFEKSPPGWAGTVKAMKKHMPDDKAFALAWSGYKKGHEPHYKSQKSSKEGTPVKKKKFQDESMGGLAAELAAGLGEGHCDCDSDTEAKDLCAPCAAAKAESLVVGDLDAMFEASLKETTTDRPVSGGITSLDAIGTNAGYSRPIDMGGNENLDTEQRLDRVLAMAKITDGKAQSNKTAKPAQQAAPLSGRRIKPTQYTAEELLDEGASATSHFNALKSLKIKVESGNQAAVRRFDRVYGNLFKAGEVSAKKAESMLGKAKGSGMQFEAGVELLRDAISAWGRNKVDHFNAKSATMVSKQLRQAEQTWAWAKKLEDQMQMLKKAAAGDYGEDLDSLDFETRLRLAEAYDMMITSGPDLSKEQTVDAEHYIALVKKAASRDYGKSTETAEVSVRQVAEEEGIDLDELVEKAELDSKERKRLERIIYKSFKRVGDAALRGDKHIIHLAKEGSKNVPLEDASDAELQRLAKQYAERKSVQVTSRRGGSSRRIPAAENMDEMFEDAAAMLAESGAHYFDGKDYHADTAFLNAIGSTLPGMSLDHLGFGEFSLKGKEGEIEFDRMRGKPFKGQSGRSHKMYDNRKGALVKKLIAAMEKKGKSKLVKEDISHVDLSDAELAQAAADLDEGIQQNILTNLAHPESSYAGWVPLTDLAKTDDFKRVNFGKLQKSVETLVKRNKLQAKKDSKRGMMLKLAEGIELVEDKFTATWKVGKKSHSESFKSKDEAVDHAKAVSKKIGGNVIVAKNGVDIIEAHKGRTVKFMKPRGRAGLERVVEGFAGELAEALVA